MSGPQAPGRSELPKEQASVPPSAAASSSSSSPLHVPWRSCVRCPGAERVAGWRRWGQMALVPVRTARGLGLRYLGFSSLNPASLSAARRTFMLECSAIEIGGDRKKGRGDECTGCATADRRSKCLTTADGVRCPFQDDGRASSLGRACSHHSCCVAACHGLKRRKPCIERKRYKYKYARTQRLAH